MKTIMTEREPDSETTQPRKRIAVACGRCRKRKIRCSGDPGNGSPCHNCKNAGADVCQFLRVASQEAPIIQDRGFSYDLDSARAYQARGAGGGMSSLFSSPYVQDLTDGMPRYTAPSAAYSTYGGSRYYQSIPNWPSGYPEESVDYSGINYAQQYYSHDPASYLYRIASGAKATSSGGSIYGEADTGYSYVQRPAVSNDSHNFSLSTVAASLPPTIGSSERLLPTPVNRTVGSSSYRSDGTAASASYALKSSQAGGSSAHTSPTAGVSDVPASYASYDSSPLPAYPSSSSGVPSVGSSGHRLSTSTDMYSSGSSVGGSIFSDSEASLRNQGSSNELSYKYTDSSNRRGSGTAPSALSNGQPYTIPQHPSSGLHGYHHDHHHATAHHHQHQHRHQHQPGSSHAAVSTSVAYIMSDSGGGVGTVGVAAELSGSTTAERAAAAADAGGGVSGVGGGAGVGVDGSGAGGGGATRHADVHQHARTPAGSLSAA